MMTALIFTMLCALAGDPPALGDLGDEPRAEVMAAVLAREQELLAVVRANDPRHFQKLLGLRDVDRGAYVGALMRVAAMVERARNDPAFAERMRAIRTHEEQLRTLSKGFASLSTAEQRARRAELERATAALMDLKQAERRARLDEMKQRLVDLEREIGEREKGRDKIVKEYVDQLVSEPVDL